MIKKGVLLAFILIFTACAGTMRVAEEAHKDPTATGKNIVVKPTK